MMASHGAFADRTEERLGMMMHVVHCLSRSNLGGGPSLVFSLVRGILRRHPEIRQSVLLPTGGAYPDRFRSLGVSVHEIPFDRISVEAFVEAPRILRSFRPSIIHSHGRGAGLYARLGCLGEGVARIHSYHGVHRASNPVLRALFRHLEITLLRRTSLVISVASNEADDISREYVFPKEKTIVIENEIDESALERASKVPLAVESRRFFGKHPRSFVVVMIARDDAVKNYPLAIEAARRTLLLSRNTLFVFVGAAGNAALGGLQAQFPGRVFVAGEQTNPVPFLRRGDCLLMTSRKEGRSLTVLEAQQLGKPVVATDVPGLREMVNNRIDGVLCEENVESLSEALLQLSGKGKFWSELKKNSLARRRRKMYSRWIDQYVKQYRLLIDGISSR